MSDDDKSFRKWNLQVTIYQSLHYFFMDLIYLYQSYQILLFQDVIY